VKWRGPCLKTRVAYSRLAALAAILLAIFTDGCNTTHQTRSITSPEGKVYAVTNDSAAFFRHGPQSGRDPDKKLPKDTLVKLIRPSFGYSKIELVSSKEKGYVLSDDIKPASPSLIAATTTTATVTQDTTVAHSTFGSPRETFNIDSNDPRLVPPPEQLPAPGLPPQNSPAEPEP
jgi:hypothetical protein